MRQGQQNTSPFQSCGRWRSYARPATVDGSRLEPRYSRIAPSLYTKRGSSRVIQRHEWRLVRLNP